MPVPEQTMTVSYFIEPDLSPQEMIDVLKRSGLAERRPVDGRRVLGGEDLDGFATDQKGVVAGLHAFLKRAKD